MPSDRQDDSGKGTAIDTRAPEADVDMQMDATLPTLAFRPNVVADAPAQRMRAMVAAALFGSNEAVLGDYQLGRQIGAGGMGVVYSARDEAGAKVAIKCLRQDFADARARERFVREARILKALEHPALVHHVDHGQTAAGEPYLVMEWLEGEDLAQRLRRGPLSVGETLRLGLRLAAGLAAAHAAGVLHRDIKPSNVFLPDGDLGRAKIIDFGVARWRVATRALTRTGGVVGTPGYMSPEQARGETDVDERTDVYSLGCVLYECLAGQPPFSGRHAIAMLAKILLEDPQPLTELRPEVPTKLQVVIGEMMQRDSSARLTAMADVSSALSQLERGEVNELAWAQVRPSVSRREQRLLTMIFAAGDALGSGELAVAARGYDGHVLGRLHDAHIIVFETSESPVDVCARAARCALDLCKRGAGQIALVSGRAELSGRSIVGQVVDLGVQLLAEVSPAGIATDETTRDLLDERFELDTDERGRPSLIAFDEMRSSAQRTVLGRATPFVGRVRELGRLRGIIEGTLEEESASAIIVTAEPGVGKSRLRHELLRDVTAKHDLRVLIGRGDALSARVSLGLVARALRAHTGIAAGDPPVRQHAKIRSALPTKLDDDPDRVALFLAELAALPFPKSIPRALELARRDPRLMRESIHAAWTTWLRAELDRRGVVLVLEDLHWGDEATIALVDHSLSTLAELPLVVLSLARPELDERFEDVWTEHELTRIALRPLSTKASRKLVRQVAGTACSDDLSQRIAELAGGNAFFLEELIRIVASGQASSDQLDLPESVLATARSRLTQLNEQARRLLRAASVFGERFWSGGLQALLADRSPQQIQATVELAIRHEHVLPRPTSTVAGNREFVFTHALVRDAVYASLTPEDRRLAHELAARWLEQHAACGPSVLADHYRLADDAPEAARWYERAARLSFESNDFRSAIDLATQGLELVEESDLRGELLVAESWALVYLGRYEPAIESSQASLDCIRPDSASRWEAHTQLAEAFGRLGRFDEVASLLDELLEVHLPAELHVEPWLRACCRAALHLAKGSGHARAAPYVDRLHELIDPTSADAATRFNLLMLRLELADLRGDIGFCYRSLETYHALNREVSGGSPSRGFELDGHYLAQLGLNEQAEASFRQTLTVAERRGMQHAGYVACGMLAVLATRRDAWHEAGKLLERAQSFSTTDPRMVGSLTAIQALVAAHRGQLDDALALARQSEELLRIVRPLQPCGLAALASILLLRGDAQQALAHALAGIDIYEEFDGLSEFESMIQVALLEALIATGDRDGARTRAEQFRQRLRQRCQWIADPELERAFLTNVPDNARLVELCDELTAEVSPR